MKINHILIDLNAILEITKNRNFTSREFKEGNVLFSFLFDAEYLDQHEESVEGIQFIVSKNGLYITTPKMNSRKGVIIDTETFKGFEQQKDNALYLFQKTIRLAYRHFNNYSHIQCEQFFPDKNMFVLFPYQGSIKYRMVVASGVDKKRQEPRNNRYLLLFNGGVSENYEVSDSNIRVFKNTIEHYNFLIGKRTLQPAKIEDSNNVAIVATTFMSGIVSPIDPNVGYDIWKDHYLTTAQKQFLDSKIISPIRLEGAAGTGKTLSMVLKCIKTLDDAYFNKSSLKVIFISHSISAKKYVKQIFEHNCPKDRYSSFVNPESQVRIEFFTLQEWCISFIGKKEWINEQNLLEIDAYDSRLHQSLFIESLLANIPKHSLETYLGHCSAEMREFISNSDKEILVEMLKFEFGVNIKGRANFDLKEYKTLIRSKNEVPASIDGDFNFIYHLFDQYQNYLSEQSLYDVDDIIIQALSTLNATIWKRERRNHGFDFVFIDETHMFNINELSIFQYLTKDIEFKKIVFAIDRSQAVGDRSFLDESINQVFENQQSEKLTLNFRSSPDIIQIASNIVNSGTMMFSNFSNNIVDTFGSFSYSDETLCSRSNYLLFENSQYVFENSFQAVESICRKRKISKSKILIIGCDQFHVSELRKFAEKTNKPFEFIQNRGDVDVVKYAEQQNRFIICDIDCAGGLEFDGVIIVGIDGQKVPPKQSEKGVGCAIHFQNYAWHNRLYVAITRARYFVHFIGELSCGVSKLLESSINSDLIIVRSGLRNGIDAIENSL